MNSWHLLFFLLGQTWSERARELSPLPPFHFWPRLQPQFWSNTYKALNPTFHTLQSDPEHLKLKLDSNQTFEFINPKSHVKFRLWTRKNLHLVQELKFNQPATIQSSHFNAQVATKMIIHGFADGASEVFIGEWILQMRDAYLGLADLNVIVVDYSIHSRFPFYLNAKPELVGARVGEMIKFLLKHTKGDFDPDLVLQSYHLIGWSWGAHVAGFAGKALNGKLGRITGLDPAGPTFRYVENEYRLDSSDAQFVDIIHTNSGRVHGSVWSAQLGLNEALGHVDVYVNGGKKQTGCPLERTLVYATLYCSHGRAPRYWTESIQSPLAFPICRCDTLDNYIIGQCGCTQNETSYMGEHMPTKTLGIYQIITRSTEPYGHGPQMKVSLVPPDSTRQREAASVVENPAVPVLVQYENETYTLALSRNVFLVENYRNNRNQILELSLGIANSGSGDSGHTINK